jgi:hypothetical protein
MCGSATGKEKNISISVPGFAACDLSFDFFKPFFTA